MEFQPALGLCCRRPPEHSGQLFDWWRINRDGCIIQNPSSPPPQLPPRIFPLKKSELCWPMKKGTDRKTTPVICQVQMDFWPDKEDRTSRNSRPETQRVPWTPSKLPNEFGVIKYPPPYTRYCRDRDKPLNFVCKT